MICWNYYRVPPKKTHLLFELLCEKSLNAKHLMTSSRLIRIILTELFSGEHGRFFYISLGFLQFVTSQTFLYVESEMSQIAKSLTIYNFPHILHDTWKLWTQILQSSRRL